MFLAKLCEALGTNIDGLHDSLSLIPGISIDKNHDYKKEVTTYSLKKDDILFELVLLKTEDSSNGDLSSYNIYDGKEYLRFYNTTQYEAENEFLKLIAKPIVRVKSARN